MDFDFIKRKGTAGDSTNEHAQTTVKVIEESMRGIDVETWYAFVSQETYHIRLSSITGYDSAYLYSQLIMKKILINKQRYFRQSL